MKEVVVGVAMAVCVLMVVFPFLSTKVKEEVTQEVTQEYDVPVGCKVYHVVNKLDTGNSFYSMQCK